MLLAVDIGNTNIKAAVYAGTELAHKYVVPTGTAASALAEAFSDGPRHPITAVIVCSVVPAATERLGSVAREIWNVDPLIVTCEWNLGLTVRYEPPSAVGIDRLVNSFAAAERYGTPTIVCSFGTATTIDVVSEDRQFLGGLIAPGFRTMASALHLSTAQLHEVEIGRADDVINRSTASSIRAGVFFSQLGLVQAAVSRMRQAVGAARVIATGGLAAVIADACDSIDIVDEMLTLDGLRLLYGRLQ